jgi:hypothetical protein
MNASLRPGSNHSGARRLFLSVRMRIAERLKKAMLVFAL